MRFFIDTANIDEIKRINALGVLDGVTTNPSLIAKETGKPFEEIIAEICAIVDGPISAEVIGLEAPGMIEEGRRLAKIHKNVVVKLPLIAEGLRPARPSQPKASTPTSPSASAPPRPSWPPRPAPPMSRPSWAAWTTSTWTAWS